MPETRDRSDNPAALVSEIHPHASSIGITRYHIDSGFLEWDSRAASIFDAGSDDGPAIDIWQRRVHPDDAHLLSDLYGDALESIGAECVYRIVVSNGDIRYILTRSVSIESTPDGRPTVLTGVVSEIHPPAAPNQRLISVLDSVSMGFVILDRHMNIQYVNTQTERHLGVRREDVVGRHLHEALPATKGSYFDRLHSEAVRTRAEMVVEAPSLYMPNKIMEVTATYVDDVVAVSFRDITDAATKTNRLLDAYRELLLKSRIDDLTGVLNRSALFERIDRIGAECGPPAALLFIDVDDFKAINDTYGHLAGDQVLRTTARRLADLCDRNTVLGRIGGDEFVAAVSDDALLSTSQPPSDLARHLQTAARLPIEIAGGDIVVRISIGIAHNTGESNLEDLLTRADIALYEAKTARKRLDGGSSPPLESQ